MGEWADAALASYMEEGPVREPWLWWRVRLVIRRVIVAAVFYEGLTARMFG